MAVARRPRMRARDRLWSLLLLVSLVLSAPARYVMWVGTKSGSPNVIPR
jgi:hypothetical protein